MLTFSFFVVFILIQLFDQSTTQSCVSSPSIPSQCSPFVSTFFLGPTVNQSALITSTIEQLQSIAFLSNETCRPLIEEFICKQSFPSCSLDINNQLIPQSICKSTCDRTLSQCGQSMLLFGLIPPNCSNLDNSVGCYSSTLTMLFPSPFSCSSFNGTPSECVTLVSDSIFTTDMFTLVVQENQLSFLSSLSQLPSACRNVFNSLLCNTIMAKCEQINLVDLNVAFTFKSNPCRSDCEIVQQQCAQLFAFTNSRPPNCSDSTFGLDNYPLVSTVLPLSNNVTIEIPCNQLFTNDSTIPTFDCVKAQGIPSLCVPYVPDGSLIFQSTDFTLGTQILTANSALEQFATIPDTCRIPLIEYTCKSIFQSCEQLTDPILGPVSFNFGRPPCKSNCLVVQEQCSQVFAFGNQLSPNCSAPHPGFVGQDLNPTKSLVFEFFNRTFQVPCVEPIETNLAPTFQCQRYQGEIQECNKYVPVGTQLWVSSPFPYSQMIQTLSDALLQFTTIPESCRISLTEYTCLNVLQRCKKIHIQQLIEPIFLPHPPCQSVCFNVEEQCAQAFALGNQRPPNCSAPHPGFAGQLLTPSKGFEFEFFNQTVKSPCIESIENDLTPLFDCQEYRGEVQQCNQYVEVNSKVWVSSEFTMEMMIGNASEAVEQFTLIPDSCRIALTEFTCKSIFAPCVKLSDKKVLGHFPFKFGKPVCKSACQNVAQQCAQIFAFGNQTATDCDQDHPGFVGQKLYPTDGFDFDFFNESFTVECQKAQEIDQPLSFSCEKFKGKPSVCSQFIDYDIWVGTSFTQETQIELATTSTNGITVQIPEDCRQPALEFICKSIFQRCEKVEHNFLPVPFFYGQTPCPSLCNQFNQQCSELFALGSGSATTICPESNEQTFYYGKNSFTVGCVDSIVEKPSPPLFSCQRLLNVPHQCQPFVDETVYVFSPFSTEAMINLTTSYLDILQLVSPRCKPFVQKLVCKTIFQDCIRIEDEKLPTEFFFGRPACKSLCIDVRNHCDQDLEKIGIPLPNCDEIDPLTKSERYPSDDIKLSINNKTFSVSC